MTIRRPSWVDSAVPEHIISLPDYLPGKPVAELEREIGISGAIKMASNENPLGPSPRALEAIKSNLSNAHVYPESSAPTLRRKLADHYGLSADSIILGNGSDEILQLAAHLFVKPGDDAVTGANVFSMYRITVEAFGGKLIRSPMKNHKFDLAGMVKAVTPRTRLIFLTVPNNPTGTIVSRSDFESFLRDLPTEGLVVVLDEAYREFVTEPDCPNGLEYLSHDIPLLVLRTFSKLYGLAGLRVGYGCAAPWLVELLNRIRPPFNVNSVAQAAAEAALDDSDHLDASIELCSAGRLWLTDSLNDLGLEVVPSQANFVTFSMGRDARPIYEALLREGIIVRHLASFDLPHHIRVTVGTEEENRKFAEALKRVIQ